jgi:hypothetical protein
VATERHDEPAVRSSSSSSSFVLFCFLSNLESRVGRLACRQPPIYPPSKGGNGSDADLVSHPRTDCAALVARRPELPSIVPSRDSKLVWERSRELLPLLPSLAQLTPSRSAPLINNVCVCVCASVCARACKCIYPDGRGSRAPNRRS